MTHHCKNGGVGVLERAKLRPAPGAEPIPVWRCTRPCGVFFAVYDGGTSDPTGTTEAP